MPLSPDGVNDRLWRSTLTVLVAAAGLFVGWQLVQPVLPVLVIFTVLLFIVRFTVNATRARRSW